jgi:tubulin monoglycylase TTLL3/8
MFGFDIMLDDEYNPWLIEVNSSPSLEYSTEVTTRLVKMVLSDIIKVVIDYDKAKDWKKN